MVKLAQKNLARSLRQSGLSLGIIAKKIDVSKSSVSLWCRDIILSRKQKENLEAKRKQTLLKNIRTYSKRRKKETQANIKRLEKEGLIKVGKLNKREIFLLGIALYWGEGFKKDHQIGLATIDSNIAEFFIYWLNSSFKITKKDLIIRVTANHTYKDQVKRLEKYWSKKLAISLNQFSAPYFQKTIWRKEYKNKNDYYGVIRIKARRSINLLRKIRGSINGLIANINSSS